VRASARFQKSNESGIRWAFELLGAVELGPVRERRSSMHVIFNRIDPGELRQRREQISKTVEYLKDERFGIEQNVPCMDPGAYRHRISLLESLAAWYDEEMAQIDEALEGLSETDLPGRGKF
jgi:hypothetical protein